MRTMMGASVIKGARTTSNALRQPCVSVVLTTKAISGPGITAALKPKLNAGSTNSADHCCSRLVVIRLHPKLLVKLSWQVGLLCVTEPALHLRFGDAPLR